MNPLALPFTADEPHVITIGTDAIPALRIAPVGVFGPLPCIVLQHGYGADKYDLAQIAEVAAGLGFVTILPDAWGHGERYDPTVPNFTNSFSANYFVEVVRHVADDLGQIVASLRQDATLDPARILLGGFSLGGMTSIMATERDPAIAGVLAMAGGVAPESLEAALGMERADPAHLEWIAIQDMGLAANAAKLAPRPVLLIHGRQDDRLPVAGSVRLFEAARSAYADPDRLQLRLYDATHEITMPMLADAVTWLVANFGDATST